MNIRVALLAGAALFALASAPAMAQSGPYVGIGAGASWLEDADINGAAPTTTMEFDTGLAGLVKGGYAFGNGFRVEGELGMREWGVDGVNGGASGGGSARMYTVFLNGLYDFIPNGSWSPYLGAGIGLARWKADMSATSVGGTVNANDQETTWAAQGIAGAWIALDDNWLVSADYRYQLGADPKFTTSVPGVSVEPDHSIHTVMLGLTYKFSAPKAMPAPTPVAAPAPAPAPAAPPPAPAPRAPETYIVFFAFDKSDISPVAAQVLDRAIADYRATGSTSVRIEGNADRSGSNAYNQRLSQRRADAVAAYFRGKGIPQGSITTEAFGEERPRVPTADGVRNDENRNAQIYLRK